MAVFLVNACKFRNCNLIFETLAELIQHIEEAHMVSVEHDKDTPQTASMSEVFRFYGGAKPKKSLLAIATSSVTKKNRQRTNSIMSTSASIRSLTPTSSEYDFDEDDNGGESYGLDSMSDVDFKVSADTQWTNQLILKMIANKTEGDEEKDKAFICPIKGCRKRYKNIGGAKLHIRNTHKRETRIAKSISKCFCGKSFQTAKQLDAHAEAEHSLTTFGIISSSGSDPSLSPSLSDPKLSITNIKEEPSTTLTTQREGKGHALSIIHPITISGGVLLTPATARHLKTVNKGDILVAHKIATSSVLTQSKQTVASLVGTSSSLVTPPTTPQKRVSNLSLTSSVKPSVVSHSLDEQNQKAINEKIAKALADAKQAMEAAKVSSGITSGQQQTVVTLKQ